MSKLTLLSDAEAWERLPSAAMGSGQPLPSWARMLAGELPRATAAFLQVDYALQRTCRALCRALRCAAMRWVAAHANQCAYAEACAAGDARRAGLDEARLKALSESEYPGWSAGQRAALEFALKMTVDSDTVSDAEFARLVDHFGPKQAASMVLLLAYSNFQDRLLLCLRAPIEPEGPTLPVDVTFADEALASQTTPPPDFKKTPLPKPTGHDLVEDDPDWTTLSYTALQDRLEAQRRRPTRLRVPGWDEVARNLPEGFMDRPTDIVWYRIVLGYAPELAVPFELFMRTAGAECSPKWDRIFGQSLFWVTTRAVKCPYCMGHCEMNWEVAGLNAAEIAERSSLLAGDDWSSFTPAEQHVLKALARTLTRTPWKISDEELSELQHDFGPDRALIVMLNACRYHYMTRISNGFQLTLERENVFYDFYDVKVPSAADDARNVAPVVPLLANEACWAKMPATVSGGGQSLPSWARAVASHLPRTAAAMLQLDYVHRTRSPLDPVLRGKMRWVIARSNAAAATQKSMPWPTWNRAGLDAQAARHC